MQLPVIANVNSTATNAPLECESASSDVQTGTIQFRWPHPIPLMTLPKANQVMFCAEASSAAPTTPHKHPIWIVFSRPT